MAKIVLDKTNCIGCGSCASLCPKFFEMGRNFKSHLKNSKINDKNGIEEVEAKNADCVEDAAEACPVQCIKIHKI